MGVSLAITHSIGDIAYPMGKHHSMTLLMIFMLGGRSPVWLSAERLHPAADSDRCKHPIIKQWMELGDSYGRIGRRVEDQQSQLT